MVYSKDFLLNLYKTMVKIRNFELMAEKLFLEGELLGFIHLYIGEEAIATGVMANLRKDDFITSTHRGHGHMIAKGADVNRMMAELYGRTTGYCKGKGGSMHIADFSIGVLGANGVVGGGLPIAVGAGLGIKMKKADQVVVAFFGDGASNTGAFHESLNFASIYRLPLIFIVENNHYASTASTKETTAIENISDRAVSYGIPGVTIDGNDIIVVYEIAKEMIKRAREGGGPSLIEAKTYRIKGHFVGDPELYRDKKEVEEFWLKEPIKKFEKKLFELKMLNEVEKKKIWENNQKEIKEAAKFAKESPIPSNKEALTDLFVNDSGYDY
ncbi:MAG: pyruvate dehydrogenase (acetyl-transferring) E1 component subunit alpha [Candidatus Infernicultor aquiphilus]|uniref:Pyruvate dehydrogenase (Acetyl-transferring) E1 component subunit alpha n=3 Tax=Candidatus Infernicultor aquiphilus TaxID=1805029 RepID=A0A2M7KA62_9BACT|nr:thiamine pyrophosphate-dependent dehydrogenase E1 component subunit alpha [Caldisericota bacterium]PIU25758.1 MAG: pyruvate dehydrogenase (acetyl-transferring) E1 component subunit alpha [Candidatus Atribacteria bacterium CG08_land_8_20_14_0_20_33_29]PIW11497.1 MAG: pyruvate dehydrogenase (acetyl-transferring) E1 component subunit alpha [Candidatus Atribacteria bacterium CG17_big_fil_post_rev_8_21_14_2_50_34_11]PIX35009.1 MAG: pyruvate dehydrogenase (acetyl-transferring) E1 component subunit 